MIKESGEDLELVERLVKDLGFFNEGKIGQGDY